MKELILFAAICLVFIPEPLRAQEAVNLEDENARINYSVGYQVGGDFRRQGLELDPEVVAKGIEDALSGNKPLMTPAEMRKALTELQRRVSAKETAPAAQAAGAQRQAGLTFLEANKTYRCVVHTIGIGPKHNRSLMQRLAASTGGTYKAVGVE